MTETLCSSNCTQYKCHRFLTNTAQINSEKAKTKLKLLDYSSSCPSYKPPERLGRIGNKISINPNPPVPVTIRGVLYPSIRQAAIAHGVHTSTVLHALERGTLNKLGLVAGRRRGVPITYKGVTYPSQRQAFAAYRRDGGRTNHAGFVKLAAEGKLP